MVVELTEHARIDSYVSLEPALDRTLISGVDRLERVLSYLTARSGHD